jgi:hypothetical protein
VTWPSRQWLAVLVPLFGIALWFLGRTIRSLIQTTRGSVIASLPAVAEQPVALAEAGSFTLSIEGRRFSTDFRGGDFSLADSNGHSIPMEVVLIRSAVQSVGRVRLTVRRFNITQPGSYTLRATGLAEGQDTGNRLVVGRPIGGAIVLHVLGIVVSGIFVIASLVGSILLLVGRRGPTP